MALGLREIKHRIRSVQNTKQIAKAMEVVAAHRLRRSQTRLMTIRPYVSTMKDTTESVLIAAPRAADHPLLKEPEWPREKPKRIGLIVISGDRGLCGSYNSNLLRQLVSFLSSTKDEVNIFVLGRKATRFLIRQNIERVTPLQLSSNPTYKELKLLFESLVLRFEKEDFFSIYITYTKFISTSRHQAVTEKLLPLEGVSPRTEQTGPPIIFEPSPAEVLDDLLPELVITLIYQAYLESQTSEHAARMIAMQAAGKNASEMIDRLTLSFNKARQAAITKELLEVVSGAEALK